MAAEYPDDDPLDVIQQGVELLVMRQEAVITAIHKLASMIDTTNAVVSEMAIAMNRTPEVR